MRALVKYAPGPGNVEIREVPVREPGAEELLIKVKYCGICGTDLHIEADEFPNSPPVIVGHEYCGTVAAVGEQVRERWQVGQRVVGELHTGACGVCALCRAGNPHICDKKQALGSRYDGAMAEYLTVPAWLVHPLPDGIPWEVGALTEPFAIGAHCLAERGQVRAGQTVYISGCGTMGLVATIWARRLGASPIIISGTSRDDGLRFGLALAMGASATVNVEKADPEECLRRAMEGAGADVWVECSGSPEALSVGLGVIKKTGRAVLIGLMGGESVRVAWNTFLYKEIDLVGCFSSPPSAWEKALAAEPQELAAMGKLVSAIIPLQNWREGFDMVRRGEAVKVLVDLEG